MKQLLILLFLISNLFSWDARSFASNVQKTFSDPSAIKPRIVGGYPVTQYQNASWVTLIVGYQDSDYHNQTTEPITKCTGTVFKDKWVLTAKHCLVDELGVKLNDTVEVWSNIYNLNNYQNLNITRGISYVYGDEDFAILRLENSTKTDYIKLATKDDKQYMLPGTSSLVFGWGTTNIYGTLESDKLLYTEVPIVDSWRCSNIIYGSQPYSKYLCTYHDTLYRGPCFGDSGGPLVTLDGNNEFIQVGVTSTVTGYGCGYEAAYTKVSEFSDTIISFADEVDMYLELSSNTHSIHWHFWQTPSGKAYLASDVHNVNKSSPAVWEFTNPDRKWKPIHNAAAFDGFEAAGMNFDNVEFDNEHATIIFGPTTSSSDSLRELASKTHSLDWHFWQTPSGKAYLASDVHNVNKSSPAVWEFTNPDRKWKPIHNAAAFDGFEKRSLMYDNTSFKNGYSQIYFGNIK